MLTKLVNLTTFSIQQNGLLDKDRELIFNKMFFLSFSLATVPKEFDTILLHAGSATRTEI